MTVRTVCMMTAFALGLLANTAIASWLPAEIGFWSTLKSLTFESISSNASHAYALKFGYGYVDLDFASLGPGGKAQSFHVHYGDAGWRPLRVRAPGEKGTSPARQVLNMPNDTYPT